MPSINMKKTFHKNHKTLVTFKDYNCTSLNRRALQDTYSTRYQSTAKKIRKGVIKAWTERLKNSFYLKAIRLLNSIQ
jgi:hypothetical protein